MLPVWMERTINANCAALKPSHEFIPIDLFYFSVTVIPLHAEMNREMCMEMVGVIIMLSGLPFCD